MSDLTDAQVLVLRRRPYIGDEWVQATGTGASQYNRALGREFFTDTEIKAIDDDVESKWGTELDELQAEKVSERISAGDDSPTAETAGDTARLASRFHLVTALALTAMAGDPGYGSAQSVKNTEVAAAVQMLLDRSAREFMLAGISTEVELIR